MDDADVTGLGVGRDGERGGDRACLESLMEPGTSSGKGLNFTISGFALGKYEMVKPTCDAVGPSRYQSSVKRLGWVLLPV